ncbi:hypothetical protein BD413DRAFT_488372 [Trametes elegans]|nr:hypothetical protein BD413DRAFT_488372 [Trametes elegans]
MSSTTPSPSPPSAGSSSGWSQPSPPPGGQDGQNESTGTGPTLTSSASLYLYTFLATLILLLLVSATIITRSYVIRRRQRAFLAEAIANGTYVLPVRPRIGRRPKMYQVSLVPEGEDQDAAAVWGEKEGRPSIEKEKRRESRYDGLIVEWRKMMPVSCRLLKPPRPSRPDTPISLSPIPQPQPTSRFLPLRWLGRGHRRSSQPPSTYAPPSSPRPSSAPFPQRPTSSTPIPADPRPSSATMRMLSPDLSEKAARSPSPNSSSAAVAGSADPQARVAVLVAMPFALSMAAKKASEYGRAHPELPYLELGVCEVPLDSADGQVDEFLARVPSTRSSATDVPVSASMAASRARGGP